MKKLETLKDILVRDRPVEGYYSVYTAESKELKNIVREWIKDCEYRMTLADKNRDRENYNFYAGKATAFREFFNLE